MFYLNRDTPKFIDIINDESNNDDGVKHAVKEMVQRPLGSKKAKQVQQLTSAVSQAVAQLGYGVNNGDVAFKTGLLEQMHQMNQQMQEQNMCLSMANCTDIKVKAQFNELLSRLAIASMERQVHEAEVHLKDNL